MLASGRPDPKGTAKEDVSRRDRRDLAKAKNEARKEDRRAMRDISPDPLAGSGGAEGERSDHSDE